MRWGAWLMTGVLALGSSAAVADDWPTYRGNPQRSGSATAAIAAEELGHSWTYRAPYAPRPAWPAPARWDASNQVRDLHAMRQYDAAFQPIAAAGNVYFGSSADDTVTCLHGATGAPRWSFPTAGPVRIAPTFYQGRLYFGSDDGHAYCVEGATGKLVWKRRAHDDDATLYCQGRLISHWPVRTGVLVEQGRAYFGASLLPWQKSYLLAVDAASGEIAGPGSFRRELDNVVLEGAIVVSERGLIVPQGRGIPLLVSRDDGRPLGTVGQTGGCFLLRTPQGQLLHGPGPRHGGLLALDDKTGAKGTMFPRAHNATAAGELLILANDTSVWAVKEGKETVWRTPLAPVYELIAAADVVFAGSDDVVIALDPASGKIRGRYRVYGRAFGMAVAEGRLIVSTDEGRLHTFATNGDQDFQPAELAADDVSPRAAATADDAASPPDELPAGVIGRWQFAQRHIAQQPTAEEPTTTLRDLAGNAAGKILGRVDWQRYGQMEALAFDGRSTGVLLAPQFRAATHPTKTMTVEAWARIDHKVEWGGIVGIFQDNGPFERGWLLGYRKDRLYFAVAAEKPGGKLTYLTANEPFVQGEWLHIAATYDGGVMKLYAQGQLIGQSQEQQGNILYPPRAEYFLGGYKDDNEHYPLAGQVHEVRVYDRALSADELARSAAAKTSFQPSRLPPQKVDTLSLAAGPVLEFTSATTAVVRWRTRNEAPSVLEHDVGGKISTLRDERPKREHELALKNLRRNRITHYRLRVPAEGRELVTGYYECDTHQNYTEFMRPGDAPRVAASSASPATNSGRGVWTHMYGLPNNAAFAGETLGGATKADDLEVAWIGPPGPRFQIDRQNRKPSPLAINDRLFVQGFGRVIAVDAPTGRVAWALEMPNLRRLNIPRDCSNWCVDHEHVFLASGDMCEWRRQSDGAVAGYHSLANMLGDDASQERDWGYIARSGDWLIGSSVLRGSHYTDWWGWDQWWDDPPGNRIVCSDLLFGRRVTMGGSPRSETTSDWRYSGGAILNPTITIADDTIFFLESRSPALQGQRCGRWNDELWADVRLVALDIASGQERWSHKIAPQPGKMACYLAHSDGVLTLVTSAGGQFQVQAYSAIDGRLRWEKNLPWESNHHGKHISRPALVGGQLILRPHVLKLADGATVSSRFPAGHTCASYVCTSRAMFLRATELTAWNLEDQSASRFPRLRTDCWISTIPACGLLLAPEGGGGCSCGQWLETSIAFRPRRAE